MVHGRRTINPKCRLYWCLIEFVDWRFSQSCWYFRPPVNCCPSTFSLTSPNPSPPSKSKRTVLTDSVWRGGGRWGVLSCVVDHILQEFNTLFLTRFRTYKIATPPQTRTPVKTTFRDWCLYSSFVHGSVHRDPGATTAAFGAGAAGQEGKVGWHGSCI